MRGRGAGRGPDAARLIRRLYSAAITSCAVVAIVPLTSRAEKTYKKYFIAKNKWASIVKLKLVMMHSVLWVCYWLQFVFCIPSFTSRKERTAVTVCVSFSRGIFLASGLGAAAPIWRATSTTTTWRTSGRRTLTRWVDLAICYRVEDAASIRDACRWTIIYSLVDWPHRVIAMCLPCSLADLPCIGFAFCIRTVRESPRADSCPLVDNSDNNKHQLTIFTFVQSKSVLVFKFCKLPAYEKLYLHYKWSHLFI